MSTLYFPTRVQREAVAHVFASPGGQRFAAHALDGAWLELALPASVELSLSRGERLVFDFLKSLAGVGAHNLLDLQAGVDEATFKACYKAFGAMLAFGAEGATPGPAPVGGAA